MYYYEDDYLDRYNDYEDQNHHPRYREDDMDYQDRLWDSDDPESLIDGVGFADPGGNSSLRAETPNNPRNRPCPTCGRENVLTPLDVRAGYQCNRCADALERGY